MEIRKGTRNSPETLGLGLQNTSVALHSSTQAGASPLVMDVHLTQVFVTEVADWTSYAGVCACLTRLVRLYFLPVTGYKHSVRAYPATPFSSDVSITGHH